jgi:hypothetical protein
MRVSLVDGITVDGELVYELDIKKPNFGNLVDMSAKVPYRNPDNTKETLYRERSEGEQTLVLIASIANMTEREARNLSMQDVQLIMTEVAPFLPGLAAVVSEP